MTTTYQFTRQSLAKKPTRHINMGISGELLAQTICDETVPAGEIVKRCVAIAEMTVGNLVIQSGERFYLVAVAAVSPYFPIVSLLSSVAMASICAAANCRRLPGLQLRW